MRENSVEKGSDQGIASCGPPENQKTQREKVSVDESPQVMTAFSAETRQP